MRIIVIEGPSNTGKTSTINILYTMLLQNKGIPTDKRPYGGDPNDFIDIVRYKNVKIGILSMGDQSTPIAKEIRNFNKENCGLVICALSTGTPKVRANYALNHFGAQRISKTIVPNKNDELAANTMDAQNIFDMI